MPDRAAPVRQHGFSLVELLVALVFTAILVAGLAQVFKSSLQTFTTSGEVVSAVRRGQLATDLLAEDLNHAGMYLAELAAAPRLSPANPPLQVIPDQPVVYLPELRGDHLLFYLDEPLPFQGIFLGSGSGGESGRTQAELEALGGEPTAADFTLEVDCGRDSFASQVKAGMRVAFKDFWSVSRIGSATPKGRRVTLTLQADPEATLRGQGSADAIPTDKHLAGAAVLFFRPAQQIRYSLQALQLDPKGEWIPCLVRDQGDYRDSGFVANTALRQVLVEQVSGFKVYLSVDGGQQWAGLGDAAADWTAIVAQLNAQLEGLGRPGLAGQEHWFRSIPTLVRVDLTTRTHARRGEYSATGAEAVHKTSTQSLVMQPRHFGLLAED